MAGEEDQGDNGRKNNHIWKIVTKEVEFKRNLRWRLHRMKDCEGEKNGDILVENQMKERGL
ncbi:MAG: hypothetical protein Q4E86_00555 [Lachnospiraceae bacterium]|nr:hypothetical protein [Lachnospiraceae bacterium]